MNAIYLSSKKQMIVTNMIFKAFQVSIAKVFIAQKSYKKMKKEKIFNIN